MGGGTGFRFVAGLTNISTLSVSATGLAPAGRSAAVPNLTGEVQRAIHAA